MHERARGPLGARSHSADRNQCQTLATGAQELRRLSLSLVYTLGQLTAMPHPAQPSVQMCTSQVRQPAESSPMNAVCAGSSAVRDSGSRSTALLLPCCCRALEFDSGTAVYRPENAWQISPSRGMTAVAAPQHSSRRGSGILGSGCTRRRRQPPPRSALPSPDDLGKKSRRCPARPGPPLFIQWHCHPGEKQEHAAVRRLASPAPPSPFPNVPRGGAKLYDGYDVETTGPTLQPCGRLQGSDRGEFEIRSRTSRRAVRRCQSVESRPASGLGPLLATGSVHRRMSRKTKRTGEKVSDYRGTTAATAPIPTPPTPCPVRVSVVRRQTYLVPRQDTTARPPRMVLPAAHRCRHACRRQGVPGRGQGAHRRNPPSAGGAPLLG